MIHCFLFLLKKKTFAEMNSCEKHEVSHRGQAMAKAVEFLYQLKK